MKVLDEERLSAGEAVPWTSDKLPRNADYLFCRYTFSVTFSVIQKALDRSTVNPSIDLLYFL